MRKCQVWTVNRYHGLVISNRKGSGGRTSVAGCYYISYPNSIGTSPKPLRCNVTCASYTTYRGSKRCSCTIAFKPVNFILSRCRCTSVDIDRDQTVWRDAGTVGIVGLSNSSNFRNNVLIID